VALTRLFFEIEMSGQGPEANAEGSRLKAEGRYCPVTPNYGQLRLITPSKNKKRLAAARNSRIPAKPGQKKGILPQRNAKNT